MRPGPLAGMSGASAGLSQNRKQPPGASRASKSKGRVTPSGAPWRVARAGGAELVARRAFRSSPAEPPERCMSMNAPVFWVRQAAAGGLLAAGLAAGLLATGCSAAGQPGAAHWSAPQLSNGPSSVPGSGPCRDDHQQPRDRASPAPAPAASSTGEQVAAAGPGRCPAAGIKVTVGTANGAVAAAFTTRWTSLTTAARPAPCMAIRESHSLPRQPTSLLIGAPAVRNPAFALTCYACRPARRRTLPCRCKSRRATPRGCASRSPRTGSRCTRRAVTLRCSSRSRP